MKKLDKFRPSRNGLRRRAKHLYECMIADRAHLILAASSAAIMSARHTFGVERSVSSWRKPGLMPSDPSVTIAGTTERRIFAK
ncbi:MULTISPECIES: hypothetical protein [unclassified Bradyrhizobium]|uniref:hypothetical protein n=1 Tax=unclassified Bradyrhizobium TaxID=2631580 RepID=UPI0012DC27B9|nr:MULTISPECIES: hypothetical protein [unclassified Bradyrhizobium]MCK1403233.1 hypothetical protein [Bradyrhizobium sp. 39]MCK1746428.1 hypothetical protein [Bradyrhizobium sp. 135]UPJ36098.1 hypothetical protein IVB45_03540 [Bradyrhizobium sp. 4]